MPTLAPEPLPRPVAAILDTVAHARTDPGPLTTNRWRVVAERGGKLYRFVPASTASDDGRTAIVPAGGGLDGAWVLQRDDDRGGNLTDANATLVVGDGGWRVLPSATLTATRTLTLGTTNAAAGDRILVTRLDTTANTVPIVNGGPAAGTLATMPVSARSFVEAQFDGTNWAVRTSGLLL